MTLSLNKNYTVTEAGDRHKSEPDLYIIHANTVNMHRWSNENRKGWLPTRAIDWHKLNFKIPKNMQGPLWL